jgi:hypothetical protein
VDLAGGLGSSGLPATWYGEWLLTMTRSNYQPASKALPPSRISSRTVAASGIIQPVVIASKNGMHRLTVWPLSVAERAVRSCFEPLPDELLELFAELLLEPFDERRGGRHGAPWVGCERERP